METDKQSTIENILRKIIPHYYTAESGRWANDRAALNRLPASLLAEIDSRLPDLPPEGA